MTCGVLTEQIKTPVCTENLQSVGTATEVMEEGTWEGASGTPVLNGVIYVEREEEVHALEVEEGADIAQVEELEKGSGEGVEVEGKGHCVVVAQDSQAKTKVLGAAMIPEVVLSPARVSPRLAGVAAEHTLVQTERLMLSRNLECSKGNESMIPSCFSSVALAVDNLQKLGLEVSSSCCRSFELNVQSLVEKDFSYSGRGYDLEINEAELSDVDSVEYEWFEKKALEFLCGDLMEEIFDDDSYHLSSDLKIVQRKSALSRLEGRLRKIEIKA